MKNRFLASFAILALIFAGVLCIGARAQTTDEGKGPTEQPSAPMEIGQQQAPESAGRAAAATWCTASGGTAGWSGAGWSDG